MNGVHDLGGMHGFGPVVPEPNEPVFHADWERRTFALMLATRAQRGNTDEFRHAIERMPPAVYLATSYYEHWLHALETLLIEKQIVSRRELDERMRGDGGYSAGPASLVADGPGVAAPSGGVALRHNPKFKARFKSGERVIARNLNPEGHTRLPRYVRGHRGVIRHDWGTFAFPDTHAHGAGANPQHCYAVEFSARELWGTDHPARERVYVDLWETYLQPDEAPAARAKPAPAKQVARKEVVRAAAADAAKSRLKKAPTKQVKFTPPAAHVTGRRVTATKTRPRKKVSKHR